MKSTVSERGQVTIPKQLRERLGLDPGTTLEFSEDRGRLVAVRRAEEDPVTAVYGILTQTAGSDELLEALRGPGAAHDHRA